MGRLRNSAVKSWQRLLPAVALLSGLAGEPVAYDAVVGTFAWLVLLAAPIMIGLSLRAMSPDFSELGWDWRRGGDDGLLIGLFWLALTLANPFVEFFVASLLWSSADTSPVARMTMRLAST